MSLDYLVKAARLFGLAGMMLGSYSCSEEEASPVASAGCVRDTDCKGERVCVEGECVSDGELPQGEGEGEGEGSDGDKVSRIVMYCGENCMGETQKNLYIVNPDGSELRQLTEGVGCRDSPSWSPDSKNIVYNDMGNGIRILNVQDLSVRPVQNIPQNCGSPDWSP